MNDADTRERLAFLTLNSVLDALSRHIGEKQGVRADRLVAEILGETNKHRERQLRDTVSDLRLAGYHICAHPRTGYFMAATAEELDRTCAFLYDRAMASLMQIAAMKKVSLPDLRGQLRLHT